MEEAMYFGTGVRVRARFLVCDRRRLEKGWSCVREKAVCFGTGARVRQAVDARMGPCGRKVRHAHMHLLLAISTQLCGTTAAAAADL